VIELLVAERMNRISVVVLKEDMEPVVEEIARSGVLHLAKIEEIDEWAENLRAVGVSTLSGEYGRRKRKLDELIEEVAPNGAGQPAEPWKDIGLVDIADVDRDVEKIEQRVQPLIASRRKTAERMAELRSLNEQLETLAPAGLPIAGLMRSKLLTTAMGSVDEKGVEHLRDLLGAVPSVVLPYRKAGKRVQILCIVLRRDKSRLENALKEVGFAEIHMPEGLEEVSAEVRTTIVADLAKLEQQLEDAKSELALVGSEVAPDLKGLLYKVDSAILLLHIKEYFKLTESTCLFSGWVPKDRTDNLVAALRRRTSGRAVIEVTDAEVLLKEREGEIDIPVLFRQPPFLKPFQMLVSGYGTPAYRTIDPTLFVGITFLVMFGMMFGDIGHGLVLLVAGILITRKRPKLRDAGKLGIYCGTASIVFGMLYGSFFGLEHVVPALWVRPLESITDLFKVAIGFGVVVVSLGIILNIINSLRTHAFWANLFDKSGPLIGVVYWAGIGIVMKYLVTGGRLPHPIVFYGLFLAPLAAFAARAPLLKIMGKRKRVFSEGIGTYIMESVVEIMEILMGYLANTVSFIRVAAFGLAHAGLFIAVFSLAALVRSKPGGLVLSGLVLVLGNVLIIALEGLVVTIQALRLEYYEFFGKFFKGLGSKYQPAGVLEAGPRSAKVKGGE
jgi:V/A-type H+-transporting ATPase subunit I